MTELTGEQTLSRIVRVHGVEHPVIVMIDASGISFRVKGTKKPVTQNWTQVIAACNTPSNVPSFLMSKAYTFIQWVAKKRAEKAVDKANEESE